MMSSSRRHRPGPARAAGRAVRDRLASRRRRRRPSTGGRWRRPTWRWRPVALLAAAEVRTESRGCHVRTDHTDGSPEWERSILVRQRDGSIEIVQPVAAL